MTLLTYGSLFSGIEAATVAFHPLGWKPLWFAEIHKFCCKLLNNYYPTIPNFGDITSVDFIDKLSKVDLIIGGSPCQSFSIAGKQKGLDDERGQLTFRFFEIIKQLKPRWFIWENVSNVLNINSGKIFWRIINEMGNSGYGLQWKVLNALNFGSLQNRKRLFLIGRFGKATGDVLFDTKPVWKSLKKYVSKGNPTPHKTVDVRPIKIRGRYGKTVMEFMDYYPCLTQAYKNYLVWDGFGLRRLTCREWERLQGFPDDYTLIKGAKESPRKKALGNSMCVPVVRWIAERIQKVENQIVIT